MKRLTIMFIPREGRSLRTLHIPYAFVYMFISTNILFFTALGYFALDYWSMRHLRADYKRLAMEHEGLKGEARALVVNLEEVKKSLKRVHDYTEKLTELTHVKIKKISKKTGIGPLTREEYRIASQENPFNDQPQLDLPLGLNLDKLTFKPIFDRLFELGVSSNQQALTMQQILSNLGKQASLLRSMPSIAPVKGWIASGYGYRVSPFTGEKTMHRGLDIAAPMGTPVYAPADGVVIFAGQKSGFGKFVMIAHGYGIVTRYGHNAQILVNPGQSVKRGEQIATVGNSGRSTGPHLHYEVVLNGTHLNPSKFILDLSDEFFLSENLVH